MTPYDLIIAILDSEGGNEKTTIELINELASDLLDENKESTWGNALAKEIEEFAFDHGRCPNCGARLIYKDMKGDTTEYFGLPVNDDISEPICQECNTMFEF